MIFLYISNNKIGSSCSLFQPIGCPQRKITHNQNETTNAFAVSLFRQKMRHPVFQCQVQWNVCIILQKKVFCQC